MDEEEVNKRNDLNKEEVIVKISCDTLVEDVADRDTVIEEVTECMRTPRPTLYEQNETPGGSIYWEPHVEGIPIPVEGTYYDTIDEALDMYTKYAEMASFEVKKGGQRLTKSGAVQHKYLMCNKEGVPKGINIDTLDPEYNKQKRNTTTHVTGCKARIRLVLDIVSAKYKLVEFKPKHNHMLIPKEYKHFTKKQRKMNQSEKMFVVKAATNKIGATRAHNLYCSMKGGYEYVHGTTDDFKNHQRDVNQFIGESDAQMLINKMENRKKYVPNFTFQYKVENSELVAMFWADEVAKCNYKEFGDIVSFDATFNSNKDSSGISCDSTESHQISLVIPFESYEISLESHVILVESQEILLESHVILLESHVILLFSQFESHEISMESQVIHIEIRISLESQMIHVESQVIRIESHVISLESHICKEIYNETYFKERFDKIVWNMFIEPLEFEEKWAQLIEDFGLQSHKWLKKMFNLREIWIPAYFIDSPLYGLMRTTSRFESENSFFKSFTSPGATLVISLESQMIHVESQEIHIESHHSPVNDFIVINIPEDDVEPKQIILDPDDQPMWESAKTVAPTPNSAIIQLDVDDNFVINSTHLNMILENKFDGYLRADPHDQHASKMSWARSDQRSYYSNILSWSRRTHSRILDITARGIFLYKSPNQAFQFLEDKVLFEHDWPIKSKNDHHRKSVSFTDGSDSNTDNSRFMEKLKTMDSQIISLNEELEDMREKNNEHRNGNASKNNMNDDTPMCECHEANYIQSEGYHNRNSYDSFSHQSLHDHDSEKSLTELNNGVKNDLEDFKRCIRSMRTVHWKLFVKDDGKTTGVLPN
ncbi:FAR1-related sequence 5-like protein [Tanacetum coccineum]